MTLTASTLDVLRNEFPNRDDLEITGAFSRVYSSEFASEFVGSALGKEQTNAIHLAIKALDKLQSRLEALPAGTLGRLRADHENLAPYLVGVRRLLLEEEAYSKAYHRARPETGGKNQFAHDIADAVHLAFTDLSVQPTFGTSGSNSALPSTAYGRLVAHALRFHGQRCDWRGPAKSAFDAYRSQGDVNT